MRTKMRTKVALMMFGIVFLSLTSCKGYKKGDAKLAPKKELVTKAKKEEHKHVKWTHAAGENGPENWANLGDEFVQCDGKSQSPINIETANVKVNKELKQPIFSYTTSKVDIINNGHTVQFNISDGNSVTLKGKEYKLLQFHFHALSEHTIDGKHFPIEVHFVHMHSDTDFAVIGVMYKEGKVNELLAKFLKDFPDNYKTFKNVETFDVLAVLPKDRSYYNYNGSLTTPPCSEVVNWYVLEEPLEASKEQIEQFSKILHHNYRPVMPLNGRVVESN